MPFAPIATGELLEQTRQGAEVLAPARQLGLYWLVVNQPPPGVGGM